MSRIVFIVFILGALSATTALAAPVATPALSAAIGDVPQARAITAHRRVTRPHRTRAISSTRRRKPLAAIHPGHLSPAYRSPAHRIPAHRAAHLASRPQQRRPPAPARRAPALRPAEPLRRSPVATAQAVSLRRRKPAPLPPPLRGSFQSLERQNEISDAEGLERILDDNDLDDRIARKLLVPLPASAALAVNPALPENRRYCRPWTARFLADFARAHAARFGRPIEVSSAVRTVAFQRQLMRINGNAAAAEGDIVSPHVTGATVDIAKSGMTLQEIGWMRSWLLPLQSAGKIDVEEEFQEACFHITVYKSYVPTPLPAHKRPSRQPQPGLQIASRGR